MRYAFDFETFLMQKFSTIENNINEIQLVKRKKMIFIGKKHNLGDLGS